MIYDTFCRFKLVFSSNIVTRLGTSRALHSRLTLLKAERTVRKRKRRFDKFSSSLESFEMFFRTNLRLRLHFPLVVLDWGVSMVRHQRCHDSISKRSNFHLNCSPRLVLMIRRGFATACLSFRFIISSNPSPHSLALNQFKFLTHNLLSLFHPSLQANNTFKRPSPDPYIGNDSPNRNNSTMKPKAPPARKPKASKKKKKKDPNEPQK